MLGSTLKRLGCCGVLVWLAIAGTFATFFIGEYLERPEAEQTFWKAGVQVRRGQWTMLERGNVHSADRVKM